MLTKYDLMVIATLIENWVWELEDHEIHGDERAGGNLPTRMRAMADAINEAIGEEEE